MIEGLMFYMFALVLIASAVMVVTVRQPVTSVLFLILGFFNAAGLFLLLGAEFLAFILLIVYVGAVAVLFLFVVMMLDQREEEQGYPVRRHIPVALGVGGVLFIQLVLSVSSWPVRTIPPASVPTEPVENTLALGRVLYTDYALAFQVSGIILLVAMVGAIALTFRKSSRVKRQGLWTQLDRRAKDVVEVRSVKSGEGVL